jgi:hypothetical protein
MARSGKERFFSDVHMRKWKDGLRRFIFASPAGRIAAELFDATHFNGD